MSHARMSMVVAVTALLVAGCGEPDEFDLPSAAEDVISQDKLGEMNDLGLAVYDGYTPPDMSGTYAWNDSTWVVAPREENVGTPTCDGEITLDRDRTTSYGYSRSLSGENCSGSGAGEGMPMSGEGSCFTLFIQTSETFSSCVSNQVQVTSGCLTDEGIEGFETGWYVESYESDGCDALVSSGELPPQGGVVISREGDGLAERQ